LQHIQSPLLALWVDTFQNRRRFLIIVIGETAALPVKQTLIQQLLFNVSASFSY